MGVNIGRVDRVLNWIENYAYIDDDSLSRVLNLTKKSEQFKLLKYLDHCDHTYFNSRQWSQLKKEIDILRNNQDIPDEIIMALCDCLEDVKNFPDQYFGFIGD